MNWKKRFTKFIGYFWHSIFQTSDITVSFVEGIKVCYRHFSAFLENSIQNCYTGLISADSTLCGFYKKPFLIELDIATLHNPCVSYDDVIINGAVLGTVKTDQQWIISTNTPIDKPAYITAHVDGSSAVLLCDVDYTFENQSFLFYENPSSFGWPVIRRTEADGTLHSYYQIFGYTIEQAIQNDAVSGFYDSSLNDCADIVWDMHQNGATYYNTKMLLAAASDSVICRASGPVQSIWTEQSYNCALISDKVYYSKLPCNFSIGDTKSKGDVLFGTLKVFKGSDQPSSTVVPGIKVMTDAGELMLPNQTLPSYVHHGVNVLPVTGSTAVVNAYKDICFENTGKSGYAQYPVAASLNPYQYVVKSVRGGRNCIVRMTVSNIKKVQAALNVLERCANLSSFVNVYIQADAYESTGTTTELLADASHTAVSVETTVTVQQQYAEAQVHL